MIEGVNLPFKTVIVGRRGYPGPDGTTVEIIDAPGLLNAVGRAGRAGRETEGWMILTEQAADYSSSMFEPLHRTGDDLNIRSNLTSAEALDGLESFEILARTANDAIFRHYGAIADGFLSFVWFIAQAIEDLNQAQAQADGDADEVVAVIESTLGWHQLSPGHRQSILSAAESALEAFRRHLRPKRARWARGLALRCRRHRPSTAWPLNSLPAS